MIEVVSAVIIRKGRILLTQRREDKDFAFTWECPGGKVDGNESHHDALRRELKEELGYSTGMGEYKIATTPLWSGEFTVATGRKGALGTDRVSIFLLMYRVQPHEHEIALAKPLE